MSNRLKLSAAVVVLVSLTSTHAAADSLLHFKTPAVCKTNGGSTVHILPGRYIPEPEWIRIDEMFKELEDDNTRLKAENASLLEEPPWSPGWKFAIGAFLIGTGAGAYAYNKR